MKKIHRRFGTQNDLEKKLMGQKLLSFIVAELHERWIRNFDESTRNSIRKKT